jgi:hypothetical protein
MKNYIITIVCFLLTISLHAQNPASQITQTEFSIGFTTVSLHSGQELMRAKNLRDQELSYYQQPNGTRKNVGKYAAQTGMALKIGFYKPIKKLPGLMWGLNVRNAMTGSQPYAGGYEEGYFFNFISGQVAAKYYPFQKNNFYVNAEVGQSAVLTKNCFVTETGEQNFLHQFGIGLAGGLSAGYSLTPFKNKNRLVDVQAHYQFANTRVEVNGIGDDAWQFSSLHVTVGLSL